MIFSSGIWHLDDPQGKQSVLDLIELTKRSVSEVVSCVKTPFSKAIVGFRGDVSPNPPFLKFEDSNHLKGFVMGRLFEKPSLQSPSKRVKKLSEHFIQSVMSSSGKFLSENYWGNYTVFLQDIQEKKILIFPDPVGFASVFYAKIPGGMLVSSDVYFLRKILGAKALLDSAYLTTQLCSPIGMLLTTERTAFLGIQEITHGHGLIFSEKGVEIKPFWNPFNHVYEKSYSQKNLLCTFFDVVQANLEDCPNVWIQLSGGLDSSALLMAATHLLGTSDTRIRALTYGNQAVASSDERSFAKLISNFCHTECISHEWQNIFDFDSETRQAMFSDRPHSFLATGILERELEAKIQKRAGDMGSVMWMGHGGDQLFCEGMLGNALADYWIDNGWKGLKENLLKLCRAHRASIPVLLKQTIKSLARYYMNLSPQNAYIDAAIPEWLLGGYDTKTYTQLIMPSFLAHYTHLKPGKFTHLASVYEGSFQAKVEDKLRKIPIFYPYYSQPLVEMALSMPVYESYDQTHRRVPFRKALSQFFKTELVFRKSKGETSGVLQLGFQKHARTIYEICSNGYFAEKKLLDKKVMESALMRVQQGMIEELRPLLNLLCTELWLQQVKG
ncbi:MAG: asparagine synthase-related protein [Alphaproteobacteria bacterium]